MTRSRLARAATLAAVLVVPSISLAYFPPTVGQPPVTVQSVPPDPFKPPTVGGLGEPSAPEPMPGPSVQTPEPASMLTALAGAALALAYGMRKKMQVKVAA